MCVHLPGRTVPLRLNYSKYGNQLTDDSLIRLAVLLLDYSSAEPVLAVRNIVLKDPEIKVRVRTKAATPLGTSFCWVLIEMLLTCWLCSADPG